MLVLKTRGAYSNSNSVKNALVREGFEIKTKILDLVEFFLLKKLWEHLVT
jgi:hypothetical protein